MWHLLLSLLFSVVLRILARPLRQEKRNGMQREKEEVKLPLFADDTVLHWKDFKDSVRSNIINLLSVWVIPVGSRAISKGQEWSLPGEELAALPRVQLNTCITRCAGVYQVLGTVLICSSEATLSRRAAAMGENTCLS